MTLKDLINNGPSCFYGALQAVKDIFINGAKVNGDGVLILKNDNYTGYLVNGILYIPRHTTQVISEVTSTTRLRVSYIRTLWGDTVDGQRLSFISPRVDTATFEFYGSGYSSLQEGIVFPAMNVGFSSNVYRSGSAPNRGGTYTLTYYSNKNNSAIAGRWYEHFNS